jgi:hypothetical protein
MFGACKPEKIKIRDRKFYDTSLAQHIRKARRSLAVLGIVVIVSALRVVKKSKQLYDVRLGPGCFR